MYWEAILGIWQTSKIKRFASIVKGRDFLQVTFVTKHSILDIFWSPGYVSGKLVLVNNYLKVT